MGWQWRSDLSGILPLAKAQFSLLPLRWGKNLEDLLLEVIYKLILEERYKEIHSTEKTGKGMEGRVWQGNCVSKGWEICKWKNDRWATDGAGNGDGGGPSCEGP